MDARLSHLVEDAIAAARGGDTKHPAVDLLWLLLMRRSGGAADLYAGFIADRHGADATAIRLTAADARAVCEAIDGALDSLPARSPVAINVLAATRVPRSAEPLARLLDQFELPVSDDDLLLTSVLSALHPYARNRRVRRSLDRWVSDPGEPGDRARAALAWPHYETRTWIDRERAWRKVEDVAADAAGAVREGWDQAPPIQALRLLLERARSGGPGGAAADALAEWGLQVEPFDVTDELLARIARQAWAGGDDGVGSIAPLAAILAECATTETAPLLREILRRNESRHGCYAATTRDHLVAALRPFG
ncbi:MAG TPA: hypothetical protein VF519_14450 [Mycobacteriales bacterium]|jgi:hypothetical protein